MIGLTANTHIWIAAGVTDPRRGFTGLSAIARTVLEKHPYSGHVIVFRGPLGDAQPGAVVRLTREIGLTRPAGSGNST
jgi:transposase